MLPEGMTPGEEQEQRMRRLLVDQGYEQPYGTTDAEIRQNLQISGHCADFVGYNPQTDRWLIAESKGSDLWSAEVQLANTLVALLALRPLDHLKLELQIYTNPSQYSRLIKEPHGSGGYYRQGDFLGYKQNGDFHFSTILDYPVRIFEVTGNETN
ncbi:MAG: hypothetical protein M3441_13625 [Chloroflexota bacterium]|nr:hypothetical protein [Chloroflexota bacterium]